MVPVVPQGAVDVTRVVDAAIAIALEPVRSKNSGGAAIVRE